MSDEWPLFGLELRTERLTMRMIREAEFPDLIAVARTIRDGSTFLGPWSGLEEPEFSAGLMQFHWATRANWKPDSWILELGVWVDGRLAGIQGASATDFARLREAATGSWLGAEFAGQGIGTEMRRAMLQFVFSGLGAEVARSGARHSNERSIGVSRKLGYRDNGYRRMPFGDGTIDRELNVEISKDEWADAADVEIVGLEPCLALFGVVEN